MDYYSVSLRLLRGARQLVYPRRCPFCDQVLGSVPTCPDCAAELEELRRKPGMRLDASQHYLGRLAGAAAPFRYEGCVRRGVFAHQISCRTVGSSGNGRLVGKAGLWQRGANVGCRAAAGTGGGHVPWI